MRIKILLLAMALFAMPLASHAEGVGEAVEQFGDSVLGGMENLGNTLNEANSAILGENPEPPSYEAQMRAYRHAEAARVQEIATVSGVEPQVIREMRASGMTWEQIAAKYNIDLQTLPLPPGGQPD